MKTIKCAAKLATGLALIGAFVPMLAAVLAYVLVISAPGRHESDETLG